MKYKKTAAFIGLIASLGTAQAAVTTLDLSDADNTTSNLTSTLGTVVDNGNGAPGTTRTVGYTITDLDLTGDGTANDTFDFQVVVAGNGGNVTALSGAWGLEGTGGSHGTIDHSSETLTVSIGTSGVTFGNGGTLNSITFLGFDALHWAGMGTTEQGTLGGGTSADGLYTNATYTTFDLTSGFTVTGLDTNTTGGNNRIRLGGADLQYSIDAVAVPEPSSTALIGLGGLALILRRRK